MVLVHIPRVGLAVTSSVLEPLPLVRFRPWDDDWPQSGPSRRLHAVILVFTSADMCSAWPDAIMVVHSLALR